MHGYGTYQWSDGTIYAGGWKQGKFHGPGVLTYPDGSTLEGIWEDDSFVRETKSVSGTQHLKLLSFGGS